MPLPARRALRAFLPVMLLGSLVGCGSNTPVTVTGTVKFRDGSIPKGDVASIQFQPISDNIPKGASGTIAKDGSFTLGAHEYDDGAYPGKYKVVITVLGGYGTAKQRSLVAEKFGSKDTTPLEVEVPSGGDHFDFVVDPP